MLNVVEKWSGHRLILWIILFISPLIIGCNSNKSDKGMIDNSAIPTEIQGWKLNEPVENYDRESIFSYIDGAGEVYRAYHFQNVDVYQYFRLDEPDITAEIFDMGSDDDAYGIFSYSRESEEEGIGQGFEFSGNLLCLWQGRYYICVMADRGTEDTEKAVPALAKKIAIAVPTSGKKPELIGILPPDGLVRNRVRYLHTYPCLNFHYFLANENILRLDLNTDVVLGEYRPGPSYLLIIKYDSEALADVAFNSFIDNYAPDARESGIMELENGKWLRVYHNKEYILIVLDALSKEKAVSLLNDCRIRLLSGELNES
jgi:hypothetical protein